VSIIFCRLKMAVPSCSRVVPVKNSTMNIDLEFYSLCLNAIDERLLGKSDYLFALHLTGMISCDPYLGDLGIPFEI